MDRTTRRENITFQIRSVRLAPPLTVVRWWTAAHTKTAANALRWWRRWRPAVTGGKTSNSSDIAGRRTRSNQKPYDGRENYIIAQKRKQWLMLLFTNTKRKWKGCGRGNGELGFCRFWVGFRSSLPSNNLSARPTDLLSAHERISVTNHFPSTSLAERFFIQHAAAPGRRDSRGGRPITHIQKKVH